MVSQNNQSGEQGVVVMVKFKTLQSWMLLRLSIVYESLILLYLLKAEAIIAFVPEYFFKDV